MQSFSLERRLRDVNKDKPVASHFQIIDIIGKAIEEGILQAGERLPSERALTEMCGVSRPIVRLALDDLAKDGYLQKVPGKGAFVAPRSRKRTIGCVFPPVNPHIRYPWSLVLAQAIAREVRTRGFEHITYLLTSAQDYARLKRDVEERRIEGLLVTTGVADPMPEVPAVYYSAFGKHYSVDIDWLYLAYQAVVLLFQHGKRNIALLTPYWIEAINGQHILRGYQDALREHNLPFRKEWVVDSHQEEGSGAEEAGAEAVRRLWESDRHPDGIIFADDFQALGGTQVLVDLGVGVPDEVMVATHMNKGYTLSYPVPVLGLRIDPEAIAREMMTMLDLLMDGTEPPSKMVSVRPAVDLSFGSESGM